MLPSCISFYSVTSNDREFSSKVTLLEALSSTSSVFRTARPPNPASKFSLSLPLIFRPDGALERPAHHLFHVLWPILKAPSPTSAVLPVYCNTRRRRLVRFSGVPCPLGVGEGEGHTSQLKVCYCWLEPHRGPTRSICDPPQTSVFPVFVGRCGLWPLRA